MTDTAARRDRFEALYDALYDDIVAYCRRRCTAADVPDLVADVFTIVWRRLEVVPDLPDGRPWVFGVARNCLRNQGRRDRSRRSLTERLRAVPNLPAPGADVHVESDTAEVIAALATLSDDDRELLCLIAWDRLGHHEIAVVFDCSVNAVAIRLHRARKRLAIALAKPPTVPRHVSGDGRRIIDTQEVRP